MVAILFYLKSYFVLTLLLLFLVKKESMPSKEMSRKELFQRATLAGLGLLALSVSCGKEGDQKILEITDFEHSKQPTNEFFNALSRSFNIALKNTCDGRSKTFYPEELDFGDTCELFNQMSWGSSFWRGLALEGMEVFSDINQRITERFGPLVFRPPKLVKSSIEDRSKKFKCDISGRSHGFPAQGYWEACYQFSYNYRSQLAQDKKMDLWVNVEMSPAPKKSLLPYEVKIYPQQISYAAYSPEDLFQNMNVLLSIAEEQQKTGSLPSGVAQAVYEYYSSSSGLI